MKRKNYTEYQICGDNGEEPRYTRTLEKARGVLKGYFKGEGHIEKFRATPSKGRVVWWIPKNKRQPMNVTLKKVYLKMWREDGGWR